MSKLEQIDETAFERYFSGIEPSRSVALYLKTAQLFLKNFDPKLSELQSALDKEQRVDAVIIAHRLKGGLQTLGGNLLAEFFRTIETELDIYNFQVFAQRLKAKSAQIDSFKKELGAFTEKLSSSTPSPGQAE